LRTEPALRRNDAILRRQLANTNGESSPMRYAVGWLKPAGGDFPGELGGRIAVALPAIPPLPRRPGPVQERCYARSVSRAGSASG
jgi:hypothetical protein